MKNNIDQYRKIFAKISSQIPKGVIGITSVNNCKTSQIAMELAKTMAKVKKVLLIDLDNDTLNQKEFANINDLLNKDGKFLMDENIARLNFTKSDDVDIFLENKDFLDLINKARDDYDIIIINEKSLDYSQAYFTKDIEDGKILVVKEGKTYKKDLKLAVKEIKKLGFEFLGVIYYR
ncbi:MAG: hypothetical protein PUG67_00260 [Peptoniphilaceae bacterium]|nr:hypothetical protein [Peptoniphilaceae bacterium]MDY6018719.1 hypothetical protein [Anaerococcus sp.]